MVWGNSNTPLTDTASAPTCARNSAKPGFTARNPAQFDATESNTKSADATPTTGVVTTVHD